MAVRRGEAIRSGISERLKRVNVRFRPGYLSFSPEWIILGVNNVCNLHCKMCDVGTGYDKSNFFQHLVGARPINMPRSLIFDIIDQTAATFPAAKLGYAFTEPTIYPHLIESLRHAQGKGLFTSITTNALRLRKLADELVDAGLNERYVSLDGPEAIHNEIRGNPHSFQWAVEGMQQIFARRGPKPKVGVFCTVTEWNIGHLEAFVDAFRDLPLGQVGFMHTNYTPNSVADAHNARFGTSYPATPSNMAGIDLDRMDLDVLWDEVQRINAATWPFPVRFSPDVRSRAALESFYREPDKIIGEVCNDAFRCLMIKSDGSAIPAHGRCYDVVAGNLHDTDLATLWNGAALAKFRQTLMAEGGLLPACARCCSAF